MCLRAVHWKTRSIDIKPDSPFGIAQLVWFFEKLKVHINLENLVQNFFSNLCCTTASFLISDRYENLGQIKFLRGLYISSLTHSLF